MIKSINIWSFKDSKDLATNIPLAKKAGFEAIELDMVREDGPLTWTTTESEARAVRRIVEGEGLKLASLALGGGWQHPLSDNDPNIAQEGVDAIRKGIDIANWLGVDCVLIVPGSATPDVSYELVYERTREKLVSLIGHAAGAGVTMGLENVWNKFLLSPMEMRDYIDSCDSEWIQVYLDVGNMLLYGYPEQWIRILGDRTKKVHFKDFKADTGFVGLLEGDVNWPEVMKAFAEVGYDGPCSVEVPCYQHHWEASLHVISMQMDYIFGRRSG
jgi:L-ribulose-5-phosphate 3-epimerase